MDKKLYWLIVEAEDAPVMTLDGCLEWIKSDIEEAVDNGDIQGSYTLKPVWMAEEEYNNLPEYEG